MALLPKKYSLVSKLSVKAKINLAVGIIFLSVILLVTGYSGYSEKKRAVEVAKEQTKDIASFYFDSLNTMMLTGTMAQRNIIRNKVLKRHGVLDARVIRGEPVNQQYGPGFPDEKPVDALDHRALKGENVVLIEDSASIKEGGQGNAMTVLTPFRATEAATESDINCLACHNVPSGTVNGAIRVSYSMKHLEDAIDNDLMVQTTANIVLLILGLFVANILFRKWITSPLGSIIDVVKQRAAGDASARITVVSNDEIGTLSESFNKMADNVDEANRKQKLQAEREHQAAEELKGKVDALLVVVNKAAKGDLTGEIAFSGDDAIGGLAAGLQKMIDNLSRMMTERQAAMEDLAHKVESIDAVVKKATNGDFTGQLDIKGDDAVAQLAAGIQSMITGLNELVAQVQQSGIQVTSSSTEIAASSKEQEATVAEQAATVNQIVATATEISATAKELVNTMDEVSEVAENTARSAAEGHEGLVKMEETMHKVVDASGAIAAKFEVLSEKAGNINSVITTITKVADQTNLLSLNAAIEAEKAGEYGVGFSVVATEIRRLADQTAVATLDIEQMVKEMQSAVSAGVMSVDKFSKEVTTSAEDVQKVGEQLAHIIEQVQTLTPSFSSVLGGMHMQSEGAGQIKESMIQLSESAHQTVESLRQSNAAIERLNDAAHGLQGGVSRFKIR